MNSGLKPNYTKLAADGSDLPDDAEGHLAVRIDHPLLAKPIILAAYRCKQKQTTEFQQTMAEEIAAAHDAYGWQWRAGEVEELFLCCDRSQHPSLPKQFFPDAGEYEWTWSATLDAENAPSGFAWGVALDGGSSNRHHQSLRDFVRAVCASQS